MGARAVIFLIVFIDLIGFGIVLPMLPVYAEHFGASGFIIGIIVASFSVMQVIFSPFWGRLSDRIGRKPVILISVSTGMLSYLLFAWGSAQEGNTALFFILTSRLFAGACGGNINVTQAYIADITPAKNRIAGMGLIGMAFSLGLISGPAIGALSAHWGIAAPPTVAAILSSMSDAMFLPSIVALVIPTYLVSRELPEQVRINTPRIRYRGDDTTLTRWQRILMLFVGIGGLWFIPTFHHLTKLPPFVGALCVLALFGVVNELCNRKLIKSDQPVFRPMPRFMQSESIQTILFFIGVSMAISALQETGALETAAVWCDRYIHNIYISSLILGTISAFLDNVALVLTSISMYDVLEDVDAVAGMDPEYLRSFALNGQYWQLVAYSGGIGGCLLSIGSTAGYALMKGENVSIWWYLRHISGKVLVGWLAGLGVYFLVDSFIR